MPAQDVRADPGETKNLAKVNVALVASMMTKLKSYVPYVPELSPANLGVIFYRFSTVLRPFCD